MILRLLVTATRMPLIALGLAVCLCIWSAAARGASSTVRTPGGGSLIINAKEASRDYNRKIIELKGNVQIVYDQQYMSCDRAVIHLEKQEIEAEGNLVISSPQAYVEGERAVMSYKDQTGIIQNGFVKSGQVLLEGRVVRKTGPDQYEAENAYYTACTTCPPAWSFNGEWIRAEMGGYAHIKRPILEVANVPVLWLPYLIVPLKSERQTGLLIPSLDFSGSGGAAITLKYFWAISRSQDATFGLKTYTRRGWKGLINYRYMLSETSFGELDMGFFPARDKTYQNDVFFSNNKIQPQAKRWFLTYDHLYELPHNLIQRTKLNLVSDLYYPRDFPDEIKGAGDPALENRVSLTRNTETTHASLDTSYYINQLKSNPQDNNREAVHRFPELRYSVIDRPLAETGFLYNFNVNYVNFAREDFAFDDVVNTSTDPANPNLEIDRARTGAGGGAIDPRTDVIRAGQRLDLQPEFSYPFRAGPLIDVMPTLQLRHQQYSFNVANPVGSTIDPTPSRQYLGGRISARTRFHRVYGDRRSPPPPPAPPSSWIDTESKGSPAARGSQPLPPGPVSPEHTNVYRHTVEPEVVFSDVFLSKESDHPFFGQSTLAPAFLNYQPVSDSDFRQARRIQFDYNDRFINRNTVSFVLNNTLVRKSFMQNGSSAYKQIASLKLAQSYDLDQAKHSGERPTFPWSDVAALLDVRLDRFETNTTVRYFPYHNVANTSSRARIMDDRGNFFQLSLAQTYLITERVEEAYPGRTENVGLAAGFDSRYLTFTGGIDYLPESWGDIAFKVKSWSALLNFKPPGDCWGIRTSIRQDIANEEVIWKVDFDYKFGGAAI